jgi:hypothetical protein
VYSKRQGTIDSAAQTISEINTTLDNIETLITPDEVVEAGTYATQLYQEAVDPDKIATTIRDAEKAGVNQLSGKGDVDAITFMRNYIEATGGV